LHPSIQSKLRYSLRPSRLCACRGPVEGGSAKQGFTLIEIVVVLLIIGLIIGGAIAAISFNSDERALSNQSAEIELLAKKARTAAILHQTPYALEFHQHSVELIPLAQTKNSERKTALGNPIGGSSSKETATSNPRATLSIDPDITLTMRRWNTGSFIAPTEDKFLVWRFDPDGLCEPITVRLVLDDSYAQDTYHPLTATIAVSELEAN